MTHGYLYCIKPFLENGTPPSLGAFFLHCRHFFSYTELLNNFSFYSLSFLLQDYKLF